MEGAADFCEVGVVDFCDAGVGDFCEAGVVERGRITTSWLLFEVGSVKSEIVGLPKAHAPRPMQIIIEARVFIKHSFNYSPFLPQF